MKSASTAIAVSFLALIVFLAPAPPVAGQIAGIGATEGWMDGLSATSLGKRFAVVPMSASQNPWHWEDEQAPLLMGFGNDGSRARREVQIVSGETVQSDARVATGVILALGGIGLAVNGAVQCDVGGADAEHYSGTLDLEEGGCVLDPALQGNDDAFAEYAPNWGRILGGVGAIWLGAQLAGRWSYVDVTRSQNGVGVAMSVAIGS